LDNGWSNSNTVTLRFMPLLANGNGAVDMATVLYTVNVSAGFAGSYNGWWGKLDNQTMHMLRAGMVAAVVDNGMGGEMVGGAIVLEGAGCALLSGWQEVPPVPTAGVGAAVVKLVGNALFFDITVSQLQGAVMTVHFHAAATIGSAAPMIFNATNLVIAPGRVQGVWANLDGPTQVALLAGLVYINIHSYARTGGEVRGQVFLMNPEPVSDCMANTCGPQMSMCNEDAECAMQEVKWIALSQTGWCGTSPAACAQLYAPQNSNSMASYQAAVNCFLNCSTVTPVPTSMPPTSMPPTSMPPTSMPPTSMPGSTTSPAGPPPMNPALVLCASQCNATYGAQCLGTPQCAAGLQQLLGSLQSGICKGQEHGCIVRFTPVNASASVQSLYVNASNCYLGCVSSNTGLQIVLPGYALLYSQVSGSAAVGTAVVQYAELVAGFFFDVTISGLQGNITSAYLHGPSLPGGFSPNIIRDVSRVFDVGATHLKTTIAGLTPQQIDWLLRGLVYVNVSTTAFPGGEVRGHIVLDGVGGAVLGGGGEFPPNNSTGTGTAALQFVGNSSVFYDITVQGLSGPITMAHFHGPAGFSANAGSLFTIVFDVNGRARGVWSNLTRTQQGWLSSGMVYLNVHTSKYLGGEIRGQIVGLAHIMYGGAVLSGRTVGMNNVPTAGTLAAKFVC